MMKKMFSALAMLVSSVAGAAEWASVPTGDGNQHFYDRSKVFVSGDEVTYWRRVVFSTAHPVRSGFARSAMYRERVMCKQHKLATLGYLLYASDGSVLENVYSPDVDPSAVVPETVGDRFHRIMCAFVGSGNEAAPSRREPAPPVKKSDNNDSVREEIDRLEAMLKRLREKVGDKPN